MTTQSPISSVLSPHFFREPLSLGDLVTAVVQRISPRAGDHEFTLHRHIQIPLISLDRLLIDRAVISLIENAVRHAPQGSPIDIWVRGCSNCVVCEVADRGAAPSGTNDNSADQGRIPAAGGRDPHDRLEELAAARASVEAHGGEISAVCRWGGGTVLRFSIPVPKEAQPWSNGAAMADERGRSGLWMREADGGGRTRQSAPVFDAESPDDSDLPVPILHG